MTLLPRGWVVSLPSLPPPPTPSSHLPPCLPSLLLHPNLHFPSTPSSYLLYSTPSSFIPPFLSSFCPLVSVCLSSLRPILHSSLHPWLPPSHPSSSRPSHYDRHPTAHRYRPSRTREQQLLFTISRSVHRSRSEPGVVISDWISV